MMKLFAIILSSLAITAHGADVVLGMPADLTWTGAGTTQVASFGAAEYTLTNGLFAWWQFEEGSGTTAADSSGQGNDLIFQSTALVWTNGQVGSKAVYFDGSTVIRGFANRVGESTNAITFSVWLKPMTTSTGRYVISKDVSTSPRALIYNYQSGKWNIYNTAYPTGTATDTAINASTGVWQHVVYSASSTNLSGYLNGTLVFSVAANLNSTNTARWRIGNYIDDGARYHGMIDDFRIYNRALSNNEVFQLWNETK